MIFQLTQLGQWLTLRVLDDLGDLALHNSDGRVGGTEIDTDDGALDLALRSGRLIASKLGGKGLAGKACRAGY